MVVMAFKVKVDGHAASFVYEPITQTNSFKPPIAENIQFVLKLALEALRLEYISLSRKFVPRD